MTILRFVLFNAGVLLCASAAALDGPADTPKRSEIMVRSKNTAANLGRPDWTVQYGVVTNPRGSSGSFGAMLEGKNPAAGAF